MFVETKREGEVQATTPNLHSIHTFIAWLETKDQLETYCFTHSWECALAQYLNFHGADPQVSARDTGTYFGREDMYLIQGEPRTFGGLLCRARRFAEGKSNRFRD